MDSPSPREAPLDSSQLLSDVSLRAEQHFTELSGLVQAIATDATSTAAPAAALSDTLPSIPAAAGPADPLNQLLQVRLGVAHSLFMALRYKHAETAAHSLRVTLWCSAMAEQMGLPAEERDVLEVAALLHDIGKIGVPDGILRKPGPLSRDEVVVMERHRAMGGQILAGCAARPELLVALEYSGAWFDGSRNGSGRTEKGAAGTDRSGERIPLASRLIAIADAYDSMTHDHVYRPAMSSQSAQHELRRCSGTQFDPDLVTAFIALVEGDGPRLCRRAAEGWLRALKPELADAHWRLQPDFVQPSELVAADLFHQRLLESMHDAVIFVDRALRVLYWNRGAERLTGIAPAAMLERQWLPSVVDMHTIERTVIEDAQCPLAQCMRSGEQWLHRVTIRGRDGEPAVVDARAVPVSDARGITLGATLILHDVSPQLSLEARCQSLHELATRDPLTQLANRAEFNRVLDMFVVVHLEQGLPCSMILCDIDHFKRINDTSGHPAGDEVLKTFARLLRGSCRPGDLVARYGGEEFVVLCADCGLQAAASRAEGLRRALAETRHDALDGRRVTSSFGVTEIQPGDTPDTMLRRADRALFEAKGRGRNLVVQLGCGLASSEAPTPGPAPDGNLMEAAGRTPTGVPADAAATWPALLGQPLVGDELLTQWLMTVGPVGVVAEKLRGFILDHQAEVLDSSHHDVRLRVVGSGGARKTRRSADRPLMALVRIHLEELLMPPPDRTATANIGPVHTRIFVTIRPEKPRDRRRADAVVRARHLLASLRTYLMATLIDAPPVSAAVDPADSSRP